MLTTAMLNHNIDNIEDKCIELITQINQHLSTGVIGVSVTNPLKKKHRCVEDKSQQSMGLKNLQKSVKPNLQLGKSTTKLKLLSCHQKVMNLSNSPSILKNNPGTVSLVHITKDQCNQLTRINQFLTCDENNRCPGNGAVIVTSHARETKRKLDIQRLNHVDITPKLTIQTAFKLSLRSRNQPTKSNVAMFEYRHCSAETIQEGEICQDEDSDGIDFEVATSKVSSQMSKNLTEIETKYVEQNVSGDITNWEPTEMEDAPFDCDKETLKVSSEKTATYFVDVQKELNKCELERTAGSLELERSKADEPCLVVEKSADLSPSPHDLRFHLFGGSNYRECMEVRSTTVVAPEEMRVQLAEVKHTSLILRQRGEVAVDICSVNGDLENCTMKTTTPLFRSDSRDIAKLANAIKDEETGELRDESRLSGTDEHVTDEQHGSRKNDWNDDRMQETTDMRTGSTNEEYCAQKLDELSLSNMPANALSETTISKWPTMRDRAFHILDSTTVKQNITPSKGFEAANLWKERMTSNPRKNSPPIYNFTSSMKEKPIETRKILNVDRTIVRRRSTEDVLRILPSVTKVTKEEPTSCLNIASRYTPLAGRPLPECRLNEIPKGNSKLRMDEDAKHVKLLLDIINDCYAKNNARLGGEVSCTDKTLNVELKTASSAVKCSSSTIDDSMSDELPERKYKSTSSSSSCLLNSLTSTWRTVSSGEICRGYLSPGQIAIPLRGWNHSCNSSIFTSDYTTSEEGTSTSGDDRHLTR